MNGPPLRLSFRVVALLWLVRSVKSFDLVLDVFTCRGDLHNASACILAQLFAFGVHVVAR